MMRNLLRMIKTISTILQLLLSPREVEEQEVDHEGEVNVEVPTLEELLHKEVEAEEEEEVDHLRKHSKHHVIHHQRVLVIHVRAEKVVVQTKVITAKYLVLVKILHSLWIILIHPSFLN